MIRVENQAEFNEALRQFDGQVQEAITNVVKLATVMLFAGIVKKTPVDTGVARGSWVIGIGTKHPFYVAEPGMDLGTVLSRSLKIQAIKTPKRIVVSSYVPYILPLEFGSSKQAPGGMVGVTLSEVAANLRAVI